MLQNNYAHYETVFDPTREPPDEVPTFGEPPEESTMGEPSVQEYTNGKPPEDEFMQHLPLTEFIAPNEETRESHLFGPGSIAFGLFTHMSALRSRFRARLNSRKAKAVVVVLLLLPLSLIMVLEYAGSVVDRSEVDIQSVRILGSDDDSLTMELDLVITNPSSMTSTLEPSRLDLNYLNEKTATLALPSMKLEPGNNTLTLLVVLREHELNSMQTLAVDILSSKVVQVSVTGTIRLGGSIPLEFPVNKVIDLESFNAPEVEIRSIAFDTGPGEGLTGVVEAVVTNPSKLETILDGLHFDVLHNGSMLASISSRGYLGAGANEMSLTFNIPNHGLDTAQDLATHILNGGTPDLEIRGNGSVEGSGIGSGGDSEVESGIEGGPESGTESSTESGIEDGDIFSGSLLSRLATGFTHHFMDNDSRLGSIDDLEIDVRSISFHEADENGIHGSILANITNPSVLTIPLGTLNLGLLYNDTLIAELSISSSNLTSLTLEPGPNEVLLSVFVPAEASDAYSIIANDMMNGGIFNFTIFGIEDESDPMSYLAGAFRYIYHMNISDCVSTKAHSLRVSPGLFTTDIDLTAEIDNPSPITMNLEDFEFIAYYEGDYLSDIDLHDPVIVPGYQTVDLDMSVSTISLQTLGLMVKLLTGSEIVIVIEASHEFAPGHVFSFTVTTTIGDAVPEVHEVLPSPLDDITSLILDDPIPPLISIDISLF